MPPHLCRGSDQLPMSTKFDQRDDPSVVRNYGALMIELAAIVPDGVVCFFTRYVVGALPLLLLSSCCWG